MVHLGTIVDTQDFAGGALILPDRCPEKHEDSLGQRPVSEMPSEGRVAETAYDTSEEAPEVHPEQEAPEVHPEEEAAEVPVGTKSTDVGPEVRKALTMRVMKLDDVEFAKAMRVAQHHPMFTDFLMSVPFHEAKNEVDFLVLWELWCRHFEVAPAPETSAPEIPVLTAAEQRGLRAAKTETKRKRAATSKGKKAKNGTKGTAKKVKKVKKVKDAVKAKRPKKAGALKARKAKKVKKVKRAMKAIKAEKGAVQEPEAAIKVSEPEIAGPKTKRPQMFAKDDQEIFKKKPDCV